MSQEKKPPKYLFILTGNQEKTEDDCACEGRALVLRFSDQLEFESDCACVASPTALTVENKSAQPYLQTGDTYSTELDDGFWLAFSPYALSGPSVLNQAAWERWNSFAVPQLPIWNADQILAGRGLIMPLQIQPALVVDKPASLTSWLHLTDRCNLRCSYCYLPHLREDMTLETGKAAIDATFRSAVAGGFGQVKLKYAGGEPLLRFPMLVNLHRYARRLADENGLELDAVVLSNGTLLTEEIAVSMQSLGLRLMISLDGLGQYHDCHRSYAGGRGSSEDVLEAIDTAQSLGLTPDISITVSSRNVDGLAGVIGWVLERDLPFSLNFYRENEHSASHVDMRLDEEQIINGMLAAYKVIEANLPRHSLLPSLVDRANLAAPHARTCGVGENYLVFDARGRVSKCQMRMAEAVADISTPDPLAVVRADRLGVQNVSVEEKVSCHDCQWRYWCAGGCPLETYRVTGRYDVKSPNCNIYQALFPAVLRLEGLRLLEYQDDPDVVQKITL